MDTKQIQTNKLLLLLLACCLLPTVFLTNLLLSICISLSQANG